MDDRYSRQIIAFGREGQKKIAAIKVAIVGVGGIGALITQMLAHLGVTDFVLIDDDIVESTNLNRLVGARLSDVEQERKKVEVAQNLIMSVNAKAKVKSITASVRSAEAIDSLITHPDIIFGCVDNDGARLILTELSAAYEKIFIDSASEIFMEAKEIKEFGGRVVVSQPRDFCLFCAGQIDSDIAKQELESCREKEYRFAHGYGLGEDTPDPAVISLNSIIAGLAVTEFLMLITNTRAVNRKITYRGMRDGNGNIFLASKDKKRKNCIVCNDLTGKREAANIKRFIQNDLPADLPK